VTTPTHTEIAPCAFLDYACFATKTGETGIVLALRPHDSECMEPADMAAIANRFEAAMRLIPPGCRVYQYTLKRRLREVYGGSAARAAQLMRKSLYAFELYLVILRAGVDASATRRLADAVATQLGDAIPAAVIDKAAAFRLFRNLVNYSPLVAGAVGLKYDEYVDYYAADENVEGHRGHVRVGNHYAKVLTLKDPPRATRPDVLRALREIPCECVIVSEWQALEMQTLRTLIQAKTTHFHRSKYVMNLVGGLLNKFSTNQQSERPEDMQHDESATAMETQLGTLVADIETNGTLLGAFALTVIVFDLNSAAVDAAAAEAIKAASAVEAVLYEERLNALGAWFAALPGGHKHQRRALYLTNHNHADLAMLFAPAAGSRENAHLNAQCLAVLETRQRTPHYANLHYGDVGHALISGQTGSGKSYLANHLLSCALARYGARVVIFDIGGSYKSLTAQLGGSYMEIGLEHDFTINPFALPATKENQHFLFAFVKVLIESGSYRMSDLDEEPLFRAIPGVARLGELAERLPETLRPYLARWIAGGQYGALFDNAADTLTCARFQAFDFEGLEKYPQILEPLLFYVLHRANAEVYADAARGEFKLFVLDEAWRFLMNPTVKAYIYESLKTWRKKNAAMWLATQSIGDLEQSCMLATVAENCGSLVLMPNPRMDRDEYRRVFKLNEVELDLVASMFPKRESLWKPAVGASKVLILDLAGAA
jgi:type IV secretion system protein VirB4